MVYQIYYKKDDDRRVMFDIEMYLHNIEMCFHDYADKKCVLELISSTCTSGMIDFVRDMNMKMTGDEWDEFKNDCKVLEELRGWLWEEHSNKPRTMEEASADEEVWSEDLRQKVFDFADKYNLSVNID